MIRLLAALGAFLFVSLWFLGADHGQYINPPRPQSPQAAAVLSASRSVFIPAQPVMQVAGVEAAAVQAADTPPTSPSPALPAQPEPQLAGIKLMHVPGGASVRSGPGREFAIIGGLNAGDAVMVIDDTSSPGWVRIRVDGQGEGWVAAKLLRE